MLAAEQFGRLEVIQWLATRCTDFFLAQEQLVFQYIDQEDYVQRTREILAERIRAGSSSYTRRLAWALMHVPLHPNQPLGRLLHEETLRQNPSRYYRAARIILTDDTWEFLCNPSKIPNPNWNALALSAPSIEWLINAPKSDLAMQLIIACPKPKRNRLIERCWALSANAIAALASVGDIQGIQRWLQHAPETFSWDYRPYKYAQSFEDRELLRFLELIEAPIHLTTAGAKVYIVFESNGVSGCANVNIHYKVGPTDAYYVDGGVYQSSTDFWQIFENVHKSFGNLPKICLPDRFLADFVHVLH